VDQTTALPARTDAILSVLDESARPAKPHAPAGRRSAGSDRSIPAVFAEIAAAHPHAIAVTSRTGKLTYAELDRRARALAHRIVAAGAKAETPVGVFLDRSPDAIVALLAIVQAGAAYLPLDPTYPADRLAFMLEDAGASLVVTTAALAEQLPPTSARVLRIGDSRQREFDSLSPVLALPSPDALACIIYTSGSTGRPKGVCVTHRGIVNLVRDQEYVTFTPGTVVAQVSSLSFDAATFEIWGALLNAATLAVIPKEIVIDPRRFVAELTHFGAGVMLLTTALFNQLVDADPAAVSRFDQVLFGGESADAARLRKVLAAGPPRRLVNLYGPTEATTIATWYPVTQVPEDAESVSIGRPIGGCAVHVLDDSQRPVMPGEIGELYIGGVGVARGYLNRPEMTRQRFSGTGGPPVDSGSDHGGAAHATLYRTGDRVRLLPDGDLEFLGRLDGQLKIRGFRIEPGEIEAALARHPQVRQAVVIARSDVPDENRLVAYIVSADERRETRDERPENATFSRLSSPVSHPSVSRPPLDGLRDFLRGQLPDYMIPSAFVPLESLPITPGGKVDRQALAAGAQAWSRISDGFVPPRDELESTIARVWEELLNVRPVGARDNFLDLGGHSLLANRMLDAVAAACGRQVPMSALFTEPTVEHLAHTLRHQQAEDSHPPIITVQAGDAGVPPLFFLHGDMFGGGFYCYKLARHLGHAQPFHALPPLGLDGGDVPKTLPAMAVEHVKHIRAFQPRGPYRLGGFCNGGLIALEMARILQSQGETIDRLLLIDVPPARPRLRPIHAIIRTLCRWTGTDIERELIWYLRVRKYLDPSEDWPRDDFRTQLGQVLGKAWKRFRQFPLIGQSACPVPASPDAAAAQSAEDRLRYHVYETNVKALAAYLPCRYDKPVIGIWAREGSAAHSAVTDWRRICPRLEAHWVQGSHKTVLTDFIPRLGEIMREQLA
jgi:amino acid adenylation domain-containing protein